MSKTFTLVVLLITTSCIAYFLFNMPQYGKTASTEIASNNNASLELLSSFKYTMSVEGAYRAIPHRRTLFDKNEAKIPTEEELYLENLFKIVDAAVVERVQTQRWFLSGGKSGANYNNYDLLLLELDRIKVPRNLKKVHVLVRDSIQEHGSYFSAINGIDDYRFDARNASIQAAHRKLIKAYQLLIALYPDESKYTKSAFYDHLCAMDFI